MIDLYVKKSPLGVIYDTNLNPSYLAFMGTNWLLSRQNWRIVQTTLY